jgi:hypothetical protein
MTYPPPGGGNPQYQLQPEPQQPSDPYSQGYNSTPPPGNYYQPQPPPQQYTQPPSQPMMPPQVGVQPGYPSAPGSILPPPLPPAKQGGNLPVILGVVVVLVVVLGIAAVLLIPGLVAGDDGDAQSDGGTSENAEPSTEEEASSEPDPEPTEEETTADAGGGGFEVWGPPSSSDDFDAASPEGVAIAYQVAQNNGDDEAMQALVSEDATSAMVSDLEWEIEDTTEPYPYPYWGMAYEADDGSMLAWAGWTMDDTAPDDAGDVIGGYTYTLVQEDGVWKLYDLEYGLVS